MKIGIVGCKGRVGTLLVQELLSDTWEGVELAGGTVLSKDMRKDCDFFITDDPNELFERSDAVIDFTTPEATRKHIWLAAKHHKTLVIATSGLTAKDEREINDASKETSILYSANMSLGVNLLIALTEQAAKRLGPDWDAEILDLHHKHKVDAPSGTSYALARAILKGRGEKETDQSFDYARHGYTGARKSGTIGFSVQRGGDVVAENSSIFFGEGERLELTHRATDRGIFAKGAIRAAIWANEQPNGLYCIRNMLGF